MEIEIRQETIEGLDLYSTIPIAFEVRSILKLIPRDDGLSGFDLKEESVTPWTKDYDKEKGEGPTRWVRKWNLSNWGIFSAFVESQRIGGAIVAHDTPGVHQLEGRKDIAALWDIRIHPDYRRRGIGSKLFRTAVDFATKRNCLCLKAETQNVNVPACRFYQSQGCVLGSINRFAYWELPDEVKLIWYMDLWTKGS